MKLWVLRALNDWKPWYDTADGFVVRAKDEEEARNLAAKEHGDEGPNAWKNPLATSCDELVGEGKARVIIRSFNAA